MPQLVKVDNRRMAASYQISFTYLIKETLSDVNKMSAVWSTFNVLKGGACLPLGTFKAWLYDNGHGNFPLNHLPTLCEAMRANEVDPDPIINLFIHQCLAPIQTDGSLVNEFIEASAEMGKLATAIDRGDLSEMSRTDIRNCLTTVGRMTNCTRSMFAELTNNL